MAENPPAVLLLDDGELDSVAGLLGRMGADLLRLQGRAIGATVPAPRDLLVSSIKRTLEMPALAPLGQGDGVEAPPWVCIHNQDFLPLRERLKGLGVHFLVHSALDRESLRVFLLQILHAGAERRVRFRLPLGVEVSVVCDGSAQPARLAEISADACRVLTTREIGVGDAVQIRLGGDVGGGERVELVGSAIRSVASESGSGRPVYWTVVSLAGQATEARAALERIMAGEQIGTRVSPLAARADRAPRPEPSREERRLHARQAYQRQVALLDVPDSSPGDAALGHDLSLTGVRIVGFESLAPGSELTLALYGGRREEPVVVRAAVVRECAAGGVALRFGRLSDSQRKGLSKLTVGLAPLASLQDDSAVVITRIVDDSRADD